MKHRIWTVVLLCLVGLITGTLGTWSIPLGPGTSAFWPALVVQITGGIWFGAWGVLAGIIFPVFTNAITGVGPVGVIGYLPANFAQSIVAAWAFRRFRMDPSIPGRKGIVFYLLWGTLAPAVAGAILGSAAIVLLGEAGWNQFGLLCLKWSLAHLIASPMIGIPALRVFTPLWRDMNALVTSWWDLDSNLTHTRSFENLPIQLKLVLVMGATSLLPIILLTFLDVKPVEPTGSVDVTRLLLTITLVATILAIGFLSRQVIRPLRDLKENAEAMMRDPAGSLRITRTDEIGQVAQSFDLLLQQGRQVQEQLRESEERYRCLANNSMFPVVVSTPDGAILFANKMTCDFFGVPPEDAHKLRSSAFWPDPADREKLISQLKQKGEVRGAEVKMMTARNAVRTVLASCAIINFGGQKAFLSIFSDITDRKRSEEALKASLDEKTVLLKEVHHRVKNNLQIVSSLLSLQSARTQHPEALDALRETSNRVRSMSLLHETLYHSGNLARVDLRAYVEVICAHIVRSWGNKSGRIALEQNLAPVTLELDQAVPCGLILSELVSNAIKHAFPGDRAGRIIIRLEQNSNEQIQFTVADNGIGMPPELDVKRPRNLGFQLISSLTRQLRGELVVTRDEWTTLTVTFKQNSKLSGLQKNETGTAKA